MTSRCQAGGKSYKQWRRLDTTQAFLGSLELAAGIPAGKLVQEIKGKNENQISINNGKAN